MIGFNTTRIPGRILGILAALSLLLAGLAACGTGSPGGGTSSTTTPIKIGFTVSLTGDFSADGQAFLQGYQLWAKKVNDSGGILGRQLALVYYDDASSTDQVTTDYAKLITVDKVDLLFGPFSTLLTKPASVVANRYGYALVEGAGGGPSVFTQGLTNVFDVSLPVASALLNFTQWVSSLPQKPTTAAYATEDDPFTQPQVETARQKLEAAGITTASYQVYPAETTDYAPVAQKLIASHAQIIVCGTLLNDIAAFINAFRQQHFNPQALIATAGPDQGKQFLDAVGGQQVAEGIFVPNGGWYPDLNAYQNSQMVQDYLTRFGGTKADISSDVAEAYSVGQVDQQAIAKIGSLDNGKLIQELHSDTFNSVQGPVKFDSTGQNTAAVAYLFQWQNGNLIPVYPASVAGTATPTFPKPNWP
jgi:branched-chain amino acid transport system substrate-binding protein